jgi:hypothetical protein
MDQYLANFGVSCGASYKSNVISPHKYELKDKTIFANSPAEAFDIAMNKARETAMFPGMYPNPNTNTVTVKLSSLKVKDGKEVPFNRLEAIVNYQK